MDVTFKDMVDTRRDLGLALGEVTCLVQKKNSPKRLLSLFRAMVNKAKEIGLDEILITINPDSLDFYTKHLAFKQLGEERPYKQVKGKPATALYLNFADIETNNPKQYKRFFSEKV